MSCFHCFADCRFMSAYILAAWKGGGGDARPQCPPPEYAPDKARYKKYHHQKLALVSRNVCHTLAYLTTLLHSNDTKDVKELMAYIRKKCSKGFCSANFIITLKEIVFILNATFSRGWCTSSSILSTFR